MFLTAYFISIYATTFNQTVVLFHYLAQPYSGRTNKIQASLLLSRFVLADNGISSLLLLVIFLSVHFSCLSLCQSGNLWKICQANFHAIWGSWSSKSKHCSVDGGRNCLMGKSNFVVDIAWSISTDGKFVAYGCCERMCEQLSWCLMR